MLKKVLLTPEMAKSILDKNFTGNRSVNMNTVSKYASAILDGLWKEDMSKYQDPICVTEDGTLINGQHRCLAVIYAGKPISTWIYYGVPAEMYEYFDGGMARTTKDYINVNNANAISALALRTYCIEHGKSGLTVSIGGYLGHKSIEGKQTKVVPARQQLIEYINENNEYLQMIHNHSRRMTKYIKTRCTQLSMTLFLIDFVGRGDFLEEFVDEMSALNPNSKDIMAARMYITTKISDKRFNATNAWFIGCMLAAYESFKDGKHITAQYMGRADSFFKKYDALMQEERTKREMFPIHGGESDA